MTTSQRLTRAGLTFILFGSVVALVPTNGTAIAATDYVTPVTTGETVGTFAGDTTIFYSTTGLSSSTSGIITLTAFSNTTGEEATSVTDTTTGFSTTTNGNKVTTKVDARTVLDTKDAVIVAFTGPAGNHFVPYTVNAR